MALTDKLTAIADNIRSKTGGTEPLTLDGMASGVNEVYDKGKEDEHNLIFDGFDDLYGFFYGGINAQIFNLIKPNDFSNVNSFTELFYDNADLTIAPLFNTSSGKIFESMFKNCTNLITVPLYDLSNAGTVMYMFDGCDKLINVQTLNTSKATNFTGMFRNCSSLTTIPQIDISNSMVRGVANMFVNCTNLQNITFAGIIKVGDLNLSYSPNLTHDSLMSLINALADKSSFASGTWKVIIGNTNIAKLTAEELKIASDKNWEVA